MTKSKKYYALLRQWKMLQLLPTRRAKDAATLREELENEGFAVDLRTVQRDLKELMEVFPVTAKPGKPISWRWDRHALSFDIPGMDRTAALTLKMVGEFMGRLLPKTCLESLGPNLRRAEAVLEDIGGESYCGWPDKVRVVPRSQPLNPPDIDPDLLDQIYEALFRDRRFTGTYLRRGDAAPVEYQVNPLGLVVADPVLYLVATLWDYQDIKLLAVHRFQSIDIGFQLVKKPEGFSLDSYLKGGALGFPVSDGATIAIRVLFNKQAGMHLHESPLSETQTITEQGNGDLLVEAQVLDTHQLRWWLLSFGEGAEVLAPESLRQEFAATASKMMSCYRS